MADPAVPLREPRHRRADLDLRALDPSNLPTPKEWAAKCCGRWAGRTIPLEQALRHLAAVPDSPGTLRVLLEDIVLIPTQDFAHLDRRPALIAVCDDRPESAILSVCRPSERDAAPAWNRAFLALRRRYPHDEITLEHSEIGVNEVAGPALRSIADLYAMAFREADASPRVRAAEQTLVRSHIHGPLLTDAIRDTVAQARLDYERTRTLATRQARLRLVGLSPRLIAL
jgi:hypothetical protein